MRQVRDQSLDALLVLDGETFFIDAEGKYYRRFAVRVVGASPDRPHGLSYSLTLHGPRGERLVGFDNAHAIRERAAPSGRRRGIKDHRHRLSTIRAYHYKDAATLLQDFWAEVDAVLREKGVIL
ncbi:MAG: DUF6516 family protein [Xanthobacteraceae bacterium]